MKIEEHEDYVMYYNATIVDYDAGFKKKYFKSAIKEAEEKSRYEACQGILDALKFCKERKNNSTDVL